MFDHHTGHVYAIRIEGSGGPTYVPANSEEDAVRTAEYYNRVPGSKVFALRRMIPEWEVIGERHDIRGGDPEPPRTDTYVAQDEYEWSYRDGGWKYLSRVLETPTWFPEDGLAWCDLQAQHESQHGENPAFPWRRKGH